MGKTEKEHKSNLVGLEALNGILKGLGTLVEKLGDLAETGQELAQTGEIRDADKKVRGIYGFSVKVGLGGEETRVEPFGNIRKDQDSGKVTVQEVREPVVDLFEEADHVLVVVEMPGISAEDIHLDVQDDVLVLSATRKTLKYHKEILLPDSFLAEKMHVSCNNGIVEIKCVK